MIILNDYEKERIEEIQKITNTDYEIITGNKNYIIQDDTLKVALDDLLTRYHVLEEEFEDYKEYVKDNYEEISPYKM